MRLSYKDSLQFHDPERNFIRIWMIKKKRFNLIRIEPLTINQKMVGISGLEPLTFTMST